MEPVVGEVAFYNDTDGTGNLDDSACHQRDRRCERYSCLWDESGGTGNPIDASPAQQTYRAQLLYDNRGAEPWPICGRYL